MKFNRFISVAILMAVGLVSLGIADVPDWPRDAEELCKNRLFGDPLDLRRTGTEGIAIVLRFLDACELDRQIILVRRGDMMPTIETITAVGASVGEQLLLSRQEDSSIGFEAACQAVKVNRLLIKDFDSRIAIGLIADFSSIKINVTIDAPFVIHGTYYSLWVFSATNHSYFQFGGVQNVTGRDNPLQQWADRVASFVGLNCAAEGHR